MKELILVRHAKSSHENTFANDFERTLTERGLNDALKIAHILKDKQGVNPDKLIASPANRTYQTAVQFAEVFNIPQENISTIPALYNTVFQTYQNVIKELPDKLNQVILFGHNNEITDFANTLTRVRIDDIPTTGAFGIKIVTDHWEDFVSAKKLFWFFEYPKLLNL